ncbi:MAG: hypothetical protein M3018_07935 [Actinomycetota bacterium]|nr:hypothetical protein [Actinomycetota bacterium]
MPTQANPPRLPGAGSGDSAASGAQEQAQEKAQEVAAQAQEKAQAAAGQAQAKLRDQLDQRSAQVAEQINDQASDLRSVSAALREQGKDGPAKAADRLAEYAEKVGGYLRDKDSDALLRAAEDFGRRQPAAVAAGGLMVGFFASRFFESVEQSTLLIAGRRAAPTLQARCAAYSRWLG